MQPVCFWLCWCSARLPYLGFTQEVSLFELLDVLLSGTEHFSLGHQEGRWNLFPLVVGAQQMSVFI